MNSTEDIQLIQSCLQNNRQAQFRLYELFAPRMLPICRRYSKSTWDAEDILQEGFIKVFRYLPDFKNIGSFEGWLRRIMVTTALNFYKKKKITYNETELNHLPDYEIPEMVVTAKIFHDELLEIIKELPKGYRHVFSLNTIDGFSHKEIAEQLHISVNTSKSQLTRARMNLQKKVTQVSYYENCYENSLQSA